MTYYDDKKEPDSLRQQWEFNYTVQTLADAAKKRMEYHDQRRQWWETESDQAEAALKAKGFEYRERQLTGGSDINIVGDPELAKRVHQCKQKIKEHNLSAYEYQTWMHALGAKYKMQPDATFPLKFDDVAYFDL